MAYQYDFLQDSFKEAPFTVYQSAPTIQLPLMDSPLDISDWAVGITPSGIPIARDVNNPVVQESPVSESFEIKPPEAQILSNTSVSTPIQNKDYKKDYNKGNTLYIMNRLIDKGFSPHAAAGIAGNLIIESGMNPSIYNKYDVNGVSGGIAQWHKGNFIKLQNYAKSRNKSWKDLDTQIDFLISTISNDIKDRLTKSKNPYEASRAWGYYEKFAGYDGTINTATTLMRQKKWTKEQTQQHVNKEIKNRSYYANKVYEIWKNSGKK